MLQPSSLSSPLLLLILCSSSRFPTLFIYRFCGWRAVGGAVVARLAAFELLNRHRNLSLFFMETKTTPPSQIGANETIVLKLEVNPALVGGLTVQIGDKFMDLSISSKIASMKVRESAAAVPSCSGLSVYNASFSFREDI